MKDIETKKSRIEDDFLNPLPKSTASQLSKDATFLRREGALKTLRIFNMFGQMTLAELKGWASQPARLTAQEAAVIKFWQKLMEEGDVSRMKLMFGAYGIPTDVKAIALAEVDAVPDDSNIKDVNSDIKKVIFVLPETKKETEVIIDNVEIKEIKPDD